jgi:hypothetical protein
VRVRNRQSVQMGLGHRDLAGNDYPGVALYHDRIEQPLEMARRVAELL